MTVPKSKKIAVKPAELEVNKEKASSEATDAVTASVAFKALVASFLTTAEKLIPEFSGIIPE